MANRYTVTMEDEFLKKVRDFVDKEEAKGLARIPRGSLWISSTK